MYNKEYHCEVMGIGQGMEYKENAARKVVIYIVDSLNFYKVQNKV